MEECVIEISQGFFVARRTKIRASINCSYEMGLNLKVALLCMKVRYLSICAPYMWSMRVTCRYAGYVISICTVTYLKFGQEHNSV